MNEWNQRSTVQSGAGDMHCTHRSKEHGKEREAAYDVEELAEERPPCLVCDA